VRAHLEEEYVRTILIRADIDEHRRPWRRERSTTSPPDMQRRTVLLRHWLGLSVEETAAELGISEGTVKSHTSRALHSLRRVLSEDRR
jgi:DNA-directed RNA polymerase specialized sigma24 family protein